MKPKDPLRFGLGVRPGWHRLAKIYPILRDGVGASVERDPKRPGWQGLNLAAGPLRLRLLLGHAGDHETCSHHVPRHDLLRMREIPGREWPVTWGLVEPPVGIEPTTFSLRGGTTASHLLSSSALSDTAALNE